MTGYKTLIFNGVAIAVALFQYYFGTLPSVDPELFAGIVAAGNFALRFATKTAVGQKQ